MVCFFNAKMAKKKSAKKSPKKISRKRETYSSPAVETAPTPQAETSQNPGVWKRAGLVLTGLILILAGVYFFYPKALLGLMYQVYEFRSGVSEKTADVEGYRTGYFEGGRGETLVLLHGFGDSRTAFLQSSKYLTDRYHVIMPDLPGFGDSPHDPERNYAIHSQVVFLHKFLEKIGVKEFYLGGNSMGGHISAAYTLQYPREVKALILVAAAGLRVHDPVPYNNVLEKIQTAADFEKMLDKTFVKKPFIPAPFRAYLMEKSGLDFDWQNHIRSQIRSGGDYILNGRAAGIRVPTLVLYGDHDQIVEPAVGKLYAKLIRNSKEVIYENCGHAPQYEEPERTAKSIRDFLEQLPLRR